MGGRHLADMSLVVAAMTIACASCAGSSSTRSEPARVPAAAADRNPCLLITQDEANTILGKAGKPSVQSGICLIKDIGSGMAVEITLQNQPFNPTDAAILISNPAPVPGLGHPAVCGLSLLSLQPLSVKTYDLNSAINSHYSLDVNGASSCAIDSLFAAAAYRHLG